MLHARERRPRAIHAIARFDQRLIESPAVVRDQNSKRFQMPRQRVQLAGLFAALAHEKLAHAKALARDAPHAREECIGPGAAGEAGGLGIQKGPLLRRNV